MTRAIIQSASLTIADHQDPTIFGLTPTQLHDRFWAARGVQVVRQGEASQIVPDAELYLLADPRTMTIFQLRPILDVLNWMKPDFGETLKKQRTNQTGSQTMNETDHCKLKPPPKPLSVGPD